MLRLEKAVLSCDNPSIGRVFNSGDSSIVSSVNFSKLPGRVDSYCNFLQSNASENCDIANGNVDQRNRNSGLCSETQQKLVRYNRKSDDSGVNFSGDEAAEVTKLKRGHSQVSSSGSSHCSVSSHRQIPAMMSSRKSKDKLSKETFYKAKVTDRSELEPLRPKESKSSGFSNFRLDERQSTALQIQGDAPVSMRDIDFDEITSPGVSSGEYSYFDF